MSTSVPKSSQDFIGKFLSKWRNRRVAKEIKPPFLDIACGENILVRNVPGGIGIDVINYGNTNLLVRNFYEIPFKKQTFQTVTIVASLNYFEYPKKVILECERVLRTGGNLILTSLNPFIGRLWHLFREPWAKHPGFSSKQLEVFICRSRLLLTKKSKFMFGMNSLYIFTKL